MRGAAYMTALQELHLAINRELDIVQAGSKRPTIFFDAVARAVIARHKYLEELRADDA